MTEQDNQPDWISHYHSALLELDRQKLPELIKAADSAIRKRLEAPDFIPADGEQQAIRDALQNLRVLQREIQADGAGSPASHIHPEIGGDYVVFVNPNRQYVEVSDSVCSLLGYTRSELLTKTIDDVTAPELRGSVSETFQQYVNSGGQSGKHLLLARDGRRVPIKYESRVFPDGCLVAWWEPLKSAA